MERDGKRRERKKREKYGKLEEYHGRRGRDQREVKGGRFKAA